MAAVAIEAMDGKAVIDRDHLSRMTFGDRNLEQEVLQLFERQSALLMARMREGDAAAIGALAHTLKGSAVGIGAGPVAAAAQSVEQAAECAAGLPPEVIQSVERLAVAVEEARTLIAQMLR